MQYKLIDTGDRCDAHAFEKIHAQNVFRCWRNDVVYVRAAILNDTSDAVEIKLCTGDFADTDGARLSAQFETYRESAVKAFIGHAGWYAFNKKNIMPSGPKVSVNDVLRPADGASVAAGEVVCFWLWVKVEADAKSGVYRGKIAVSAGKDKCELPLEIEVSPCTLPDVSRRPFSMEFWQYPYSSSDYYGLKPFDEKHRLALSRHLEYYKSIGGRGITATITEEAWGGQTYGKGDVKYPSMVKWIKGRDGRMRFDYADFDAWVDIAAKAGVSDKIVCYSMLPWGSKIAYYDEKSGKKKTMHVPVTLFGRYKKVWKIFLENFVAHLDDKGIFDNVYIGFDERHNLTKTLDFVASIKNRDGKSLKYEAAFNAFMSEKDCFSKLDYASVGLDIAARYTPQLLQICRERSAENKETTLYTATEHFPNSFALSLPCESYWTMAFCGKCAASGFLRWAFDAWTEAPLEDTTHSSFPAGDCFLIYPSFDASYTPCPSVRLAKLAEGARDINKLYVIAQNGQCAQDIQSLFDTVRYDYSYRVEYDSSWGPAIRKARWADEQGAAALLADTRAFKSGVEEISRKYAAAISEKKAR